MSTIDQAFIRAYQQDVALGNVVGSSYHPTASHPTAPNIAEPAATKTSLSTALESTSPMDSVSTSTPTHHTDTLGDDARLEQFASVHIGLGSVVPPPHANFGLASTVAGRSGSAAARRVLLRQSAKVSLSTFVEQITAASSVTEPFKPALEVDAVRWPAICQTLLTRHAERFDRLAEELCHQAETGRQTIAITGIDRGEGRTTLTLCLAKQLAAAGVKLALLDADFDHPSLANQLGIQIHQGWDTALASDEPLAEAMIESLADRFAIVPLGSSTPPDATPQVEKIAVALNELKSYYDLILLDAGPLCGLSGTAQWLLEPSLSVDGIIVAHDVRQGAAHRVASVCLQLADAAKAQFGIAEMFVVQE